MCQELFPSGRSGLGRSPYRSVSASRRNSSASSSKPSASRSRLRRRANGGANALRDSQTVPTSRPTVSRWADGNVRPNYQYRKALLNLAEDLGLARVLTDLRDGCPIGPTLGSGASRDHPKVGSEMASRTILDTPRHSTMQSAGPRSDACHTWSPAPSP